MIKTYEIVEKGKAIKCLRCGLTSWHPEDVRQLYCGNCHEFHERLLEIARTYRRPHVEKRDDPNSRFRAIFPWAYKKIK